MAVFIDVGLGRAFCMLARMYGVGPRRMGVMGGLFVTARFVMPGRFCMVFRGVGVVLSSLLVMIGGGLGHD